MTHHYHYACLTNAMPPVGSSVTACAIRNHKCCILVLKYAVFSFSCRFFRFSLVFVNGIVIFSFLVIFVFVFVNENHTALKYTTQLVSV